MSRKGESIFKRKDGRWEGRYIKGRNLQGKAIYGSVYGSSYAQTREKLRQKAAGIEVSQKKMTNSVPAGTGMTFGTLTENWLRARRTTVKEATYIKYRNLLNNYVMPRIGSMPIMQISADTLQGYYHWLLNDAGEKKQGLSAKTVSDVFSVIRSVLRYARLQKIPVSCTGTEITIRSARQELNILSAGEQERLVGYLEAHPSGRNLGILLCLFTGLRLGEICALRWEDISKREQTIYVHQTMQRLQLVESDTKKTSVIVTTPKSQCSIRLIPVTPALWPILDEFSAESGYVLTGTDAYVEPRTMENHFKRVLKQAGLSDVNFHCLRHTFATRCVEVGFDIKTLSEILGHANISITMNRYVHPTMQMKRENMERLSSLFLVR